MLIFDSGVGGLSILQEIRRKLPGCELVYACDNGAFPYGTKPEHVLVSRVEKVLKALLPRVEPDIVVIACNTASTVALPKIRAHFTRPVVGVVPAIKPAAAFSQSRVIGLLGTPGTVSRAYTQQLITEFAGDCRVVRVGSGELVQLAEDKLRGKDVSPEKIRDIISPIVMETELDTVVLACTHFPLLLPELIHAAPRPLHWIDSGEAIARRVQSLLDADHRTTAIVPRDTAFACWLTAEDPDIDRLRLSLLGMGAGKLHLLGEV